MTRKDEPKQFELEEKIWGRRLYEGDEITLLLEFLNTVFLGKFDNKNLPKTPLITCESHLLLRALIFANSYLSHADSWDLWEAKFKQNLEDNCLPLSNWNANNLKGTFTNFDDFKKAILLIQRSLPVDTSGRKWNNRFLFPWSKAQLFPDVEIKNSGSIEESVSCKRHYFGHTGEIAYLLLCLADNREELQQKLEKKFDPSNSPMARLCSLIEKDFSTGPCVNFQEGSGFLPSDYNQSSVIKHRVEWLCKDLLALLSLRLRTEDIVNPMGKIIGLHLLCYQIERAQEISQDPRFKKDGKPYFLCEVLQKKPSPVRRASIANHKMNQTLGFQVLSEVFSRLYDMLIEDNKNGTNRLDGSAPKTLSTVENEIYLELQSRLEEDADPEEQKKTFYDQIRKKYEKHLGIFHQRMANFIGLRSRELTNSYRYTVNSDLLLALAAVNVPDKYIPVRVFLDSLFEKYGIFFDELRSSKTLSTFQIEQKDLANNYGRLLEQFKSLGILYHLSDGFDYICNPYERENSDEQ